MIRCCGQGAGAGLRADIASKVRMLSAAASAGCARGQVSICPAQLALSRVLHHQQHSCLIERQDLMASLIQGHLKDPSKFGEGDVFAVAHGAMLVLAACPTPWKGLIPC